MENLHVSIYSDHHQILSTFLLQDVHILCLNRVVILRSQHRHHLRAFVKLRLVGCLLCEWICR